MKYIKNFSVAFILGLIISGLTLTAYATTYYYYSITHDFICEYEYYNKSTLAYKNSSSVAPGGTTGTYESDGVPAGYMGLKVRLYDDSGSLVSSSSTIYNSYDNVVAISKTLSSYCSDEGSYYSKCISYVWNYAQYIDEDGERTVSITIN